MERRLSKWSEIKSKMTAFIHLRIMMWQKYKEPTIMARIIKFDLDLAHHHHQNDFSVSGQAL